MVTHSVLMVTLYVHGMSCFFFIVIFVSFPLNEHK